jgi:amino-acid N-acetyltransferase
VKKTDLPHKVWGECYRCPKFPDCDEEALILYLEKEK